MSRRFASETSRCVVLNGVTLLKIYVEIVNLHLAREECCLVVSWENVRSCELCTPYV